VAGFGIIEMAMGRESDRQGDLMVGWAEDACFTTGFKKF
jgi:hypothetical protein